MLLSGDRGTVISGGEASVSRGEGGEQGREGGRVGGDAAAATRGGSDKSLIAFHAHRTPGKLRRRGSQGGWGVTGIPRRGGVERGAGRRVSVGVGMGALEGGGELE